MIELYAITDRAAPPPPPPLRALPCDGLAVICGPAAEEELTEEALWRHERLVEELMAERDLVPVRYGTRVPGDDEATAAIAPRGGELRAALERVRGAVELSLRVRTQEADGEGGDDELDAPLRPLARAIRTRPTADEHELLRRAYLVDREATARVAEAVARLQAEHPELAFLLTGPWPPYSFVEGDR